MDEAGGKGSLPDHPRNKDLGVLDIAALGEGLGVSGPPSSQGWVVALTLVLALGQS